uniref:Transmembrane protein n=1 Tax=Paramyxoviridae sp. TaxID=1663356 RepID=A0A858HQ04_9MONO|nr:transmembrane protein [Paramyxoviridae sp.]
MTSDYEDPASLPSCYGSMGSSHAPYKATQIRRSHASSAARYIRGSRSAVRSERSYNIYFAFILFVSSINLAMLCYVIITLESRVQFPAAGTTKPLPKVEGSNCADMDQLLSSVNTVINAISYTLPQVLTSNKHSLITRMNHLVMEIKDIVRANNLDLNVKLGLNRTIALRTGNHFDKDGSTSSARPKPTKPPWTPRVTLLPVRPTNKVMFYPLREAGTFTTDDKIFDSIRRLNQHHNNGNGDIEHDISNMNPAF